MIKVFVRGEECCARDVRSCRNPEIVLSHWAGWLLDVLGEVVDLPIGVDELPRGDWYRDELEQQIVNELPLLFTPAPLQDDRCQLARRDAARTSSSLSSPGHRPKMAESPERGP